MARSQATFSKKEKEAKRKKKREDKQEKMEERKANAKKGKSLEEMMAYMDENGNLTSTPPDPRKKREIRAEDIDLSMQKRDPLENLNGERTGTITFFNTSKGYGFIKDQKTGESIFVHTNALQSPVKENDKVSFEVEMSHKGLNALSVKLIR